MGRKKRPGTRQPEERAANQVHRQLELLKYLGGRDRRNRPSGEGLRIDILLLPDLLIDFHQYNLSESRNVCAVGGRAARLACALLHLASDDDATFGVHLLAKTGPLGYELLRQQFDVGESKRSALLCFDTVNVRKGEPRCAILQARGGSPESGAPVRDMELSREDLHREPIPSVLDRVSSIYFSSITTPDFEGLFSGIKDRMDPARQVLFLDITRGAKHGPHHLRRCLEMLRSKEELPVKLFVNDEMQKHLLEAAGKHRLSQLCHEEEIAIVRYGRQGLRYLDERGKIPAKWDGVPLDFSQDGIPERFKAGVLLAASLYRRVELPPEKGDPNAQTLKDLADEWHEHGNPWQTILEYGVRVASAEPDQAGGHATMRSVVKGCPDHDCSDFEGIGSGEAIKTRYEDSCHGRILIVDNDTMSPYIARLAALRRLDAVADLKLARCNLNLPRCEDCPASKDTGAGAAVMIDLDGTLMDSTAERNRGLAVALEQLSSVAQWPPSYPVDRDVSTEVGFFSRYVYDNWELFRNCKFGDFRQEWNHPGWYAMYILLLTQEQWYARIKQATKEPRLRHPLHEAEWIRHLAEEYHRALNDYQADIEKAREAFRKVPLLPFKEARDLLRSLIKCGFDIYIVSEGQPEAQLDKIHRTGLDEFFDRRRVLTTGDAASPEDEIEALRREETQLRRRKSELLRQRGVCVSQRATLSVLELAVEQTKCTAKRELTRQNRKLGRRYRRIERRLDDVGRYLRLAEFARLVLKRMSAKSGPPFYAAVVRAILRDRENPLRVLTSFRQLMEPLPPDKRVKIKFAMVGDRAKKDIAPPVELLGPTNVLTIRLASGKYHDERADDSSSLLVAQTLAQVKLLLLCRETWCRDDVVRVRCPDDPPIFDWTVHTAEREYFPKWEDESDRGVGINWINRALAMPGDQYHVVPNICAGILAEYIQRSPDCLQDILGEYLKPVTDLEEVRKRLRRLCRLVETGILERVEARGYPEQCVKVICYDVERLRKPGRHGNPELQMGWEALRHLSKHQAAAVPEDVRKRIEEWGWR